MEVGQAILERRAYRALEKVEVTEELVSELAHAASLSPSCNNSQPWRYCFVYEKDALDRVKDCLTEGNRWARDASMIVAAYSRKEDDCVIKERAYNSFDLGLATAFMMLKAAEIGLVAHPIAGYSPSKVAQALDIPPEYQVITLINVGRHSKSVPEWFSDNHKLAERQRPPRKAIWEMAFANRHGRGIK